MVFAILPVNNRNGPKIKYVGGFRLSAGYGRLKIGADNRKILDFLTHGAHQKNPGQDARASGPRDRSETSCDRSELD